MSRSMRQAQQALWKKGILSVGGGGGPAVIRSAALLQHTEAAHNHHAPLSSARIIPSTCRRTIATPTKPVLMAKRKKKKTGGIHDIVKEQVKAHWEHVRVNNIRVKQLNEERLARRAAMAKEKEAAAKSEQ